MQKKLYLIGLVFRGLMSSNRRLKWKCHVAGSTAWWGCAVLLDALWNWSGAGHSLCPHGHEVRTACSAKQLCTAFICAHTHTHTHRCIFSLSVYVCTHLFPLLENIWPFDVPKMENFHCKKPILTYTHTQCVHTHTHTHACMHAHAHTHHAPKQQQKKKHIYDVTMTVRFWNNFVAFRELYKMKMSHVLKY